MIEDTEIYIKTRRFVVMESGTKISVVTYGTNNLIKQRQLERKYYSEVLNKLIKMDKEETLTGIHMLVAIESLYWKGGVEPGYTILRNVQPKVFKRKTEYSNLDLIKTFEELEEDFYLVASGRDAYCNDASSPLWIRIYGYDYSPNVIEALRNPETNKILFYPPKNNFKNIERGYSRILYTSLKKQYGYENTASFYDIETRRLALYGYTGKIDYVYGYGGKTDYVHGYSGIRRQEIPALFIDDLVIQLTIKELDSMGYDFSWDYVESDNAE